ncbi:MAG: methyltransferase domain-containing protein [Hyphomicrobiales bacterium]|nr:methyltransferase domain-containing protein [Hyphomicrobiales bacterium]MBV8823721.1 methyltransferase domain-containing protein [Hyphomicrobiales bacterium]
MRDWISFWDSDHSIYVNARHFDVHYRTIADMIVRHVPSPDAVVLDFGCGEALHADRVAAACQRLILVDAATKVRTGLAARFSGNPTIEIRAPAELADLADRSIDLVVMHSVAQYLTSAEFSALLVLFRRLLRPGGLLLIGDVIPPQVSAFADAIALLNYGAANGFLLAAIRGLLRTAVSDYTKLRSRIGVTLYTEAEMLQRLEAAGFTATRAKANVGPNPARMTFLARSG